MSTQTGPEQPRPPEARSLPRARSLAVAPQRLGLSLTVLSVAAFVAGLDLFIVNVAFDAISRDFGGAVLADLSWVLNGYAIVFAALLVPLGRLSDRLGRKRVFVLGLALFTAASAACALAGGLWTLVVCRVLQAVGAAALTPASLGLLLSVFPAERRQAAVRVWSASAALAAAAGPVFGGLLVSASWRWVFLVNIPVGVLALLVAVRVLPESREATARHLPDLAGTCLLTGSIGLLALGLVKVNDWSAGLTSTLVVAAAGGGAAFWRRSLRHPAPVIEPALLRVRAFAWSNVTALVFTAALAANLLTAILWMQQVWDYSALRTGLGVAPGPLMVPVAALVAGRLAPRFTPGALTAAGCLLCAVGAATLALSIGRTPHYATELLPGWLIGGAGVGLALPTILASATADLPEARFSTGSAVVNMSRQIGSVLGISLLIAILGTPHTYDATHRAFVHAWVAIGALMLLGAVAALGMAPRPAAGRLPAGPVEERPAHPLRRENP
ncbi:MFS transporter [Streptomyces buecherae]|uniref:MFS transporter n=1 Tax=Streptomyces buecherae TaxID=2763006 RepID=UPI001C279CFC|nr:MFS transporter [Streptomyces buecherae]